jgi:hypothetical protein
MKYCGFAAAMRCLSAGQGAAASLDKLAAVAFARPQGVGRLADPFRPHPPDDKKLSEPLVDKPEAFLHLRFPEAVGGTAAAFRPPGDKVVFAHGALDATKAMNPPHGADTFRLVFAHDSKKTETLSGEVAHLFWETVVGKFKKTGD